MAKITDPSSIALTTDIVIDTTNFDIELLSTGAIDSSDGITLQAVYSFAINLWNTNTTYTAFPFPFRPIGTGEQFDVINGWNFKNTATRELLRDGGYAVRATTSANSTEEWMCIIGLGAVADSSHHIYFQQASEATTIDADRTGQLNQVIQIWRDDNADGTADEDYTGYFKAFLRVQGYYYSDYDLLTEQGYNALTYQPYRIPLTNSVDLDDVTTDTAIASGGSGVPDTAPYNDIDVTYLDGTGFAAWTNSTVYAANAVVSDGGHWYITTAGGTSSGSGVGNDAGVTDWTAYSGERNIDGTYYAYNIIIDGNADGSGGNPTKEQIYAWSKYILRQDIDIDADADSRKGKTAPELLDFVGSELTTKAGVFVDNYLASEQNDYTFTDVGGTPRTFIVVTLASASITGLQNSGSATRTLLQIYNTTAASSNTWAVATAYSIGDRVLRTTGLGIENTGGLWFLCTTAGTSHASTEPTWDTTPGNTTSDNGVVWTCYKALLYDADPGGATYSDSYTDGEEYAADDILRIRHTELVSTSSFHLVEATAVVSATGWSVLLAPASEEVYTSNAVDGSGVTGFALDVGDLEFNVTLDADFTAAQAFAWYCYELTGTNGMHNFWGAVTAIDVANYRLNNDVIDVHFDETIGAFMRQTDSARIFRKDGARPVVDPTTGGYGIEMNWQNPVYIAETGVSGLTAGESLLLSDAATGGWVVEGAVTAKQSLQLQNAAAAAKVSGGGTTNVKLRDLADTKDRIDATVDSNGNRSSVTVSYD